MSVDIANMSEQPLMDESILNELKEITEGESELFIEIIEIYQQQCPELIGTIKAAIESQDAEKLHTDAHSLKGISYNVGATTMGELAGMLETYGRDNNMTDAKQLISSLAEISEQTLSHLEALK